MQCTNKACKSKDNKALYHVDFEILTDLGVKRNQEALCEKCAVNLLQWGLAYKERNKFKLHRYMTIEDYTDFIRGSV